MSAEAHNPNPLQPGTHLADYTITGVLGEGGFGIVYGASDERLGRTIAIKEYLPASIAGRTGDLSVRVRSLNNLDAFNNGLQSFMREAKLLAQFSHPALVEVYRVWEENHTAYIAMRLCGGQTARDARSKLQTGMGEAEIGRMLRPVFDAVATLHSKDVIHRDISPDNVMISSTGTATLLDLGAARIVLGGLTQALTTVLKPGYAPIEQYMDDGSMKQGPWTDVYGLAALVYYLVMGQPPAQSIGRSLNDTLQPLPADGEGAYSRSFCEAITRGLAVQPSARFQSVAEFATALGWSLGTSEAKGVAVTPVSTPAEHIVETVAVSPPKRSEVSVPAIDGEKTVVPVRRSTSRATTPALENDGTAPGRTRRTPLLIGGALFVSLATGIGVWQWIPKSSPQPTIDETTKAVHIAIDELVKRLPPNENASTLPPRKEPVTETKPTSKESTQESASSAQQKRATEERLITEQKKAELAQAAIERKKRDDDERIALKKKLDAESTANEKKQRDEKAVAEKVAEEKKRAEQEKLARARTESASKSNVEPAKEPIAGIVQERVAPPPSNQAVNDLFALALKAYRDGQVRDARGYWSQIVELPEASPRARAQALANSARTYCTGGDRASCERLYTQAIKTDSSFRLSENDSANPQIGDAYRAARGKAAGY